MKTDAENLPIAFEMARRIVTAVVTVETVETGVLVPTITLNAIPGTPMRTLNAAAHYLALLAELGSGPSALWAIRIEVDHIDLARVLVEPFSGTADEISRARIMLEDVVAAAQLTHPVTPPTN